MAEAQHQYIRTYAEETKKGSNDKLRTYAEEPKKGSNDKLKG
jgi:hypothetical protein